MLHNAYVHITLLIVLCKITFCRFGRAFFVHPVQKFNFDFPENICGLHYKYGLINAIRMGRRRSEICLSYGDLTEDSDVALCRWAISCRRFVPLLPR